MRLPLSLLSLLLQLRLCMLKNPSLLLPLLL
jgi:hypothetical protein